MHSSTITSISNYYFELVLPTLISSYFEVCILLYSGCLYCTSTSNSCIRLDSIDKFKKGA